MPADVGPSFRLKTRVPLRRERLSHTVVIIGDVPTKADFRSTSDGLIASISPLTPTFCKRSSKQELVHRLPAIPCWLRATTALCPAAAGAEVAETAAFYARIGNELVHAVGAHATKTLHIAMGKSDTALPCRGMQQPTAGRRHGPDRNLSVGMRRISVLIGQAADCGDDVD